MLISFDFKLGGVEDVRVDGLLLIVPKTQIVSLKDFRLFKFIFVFILLLNFYICSLSF